MRNALRQMLGSKKAIASFTGGVSSVITQLVAILELGITQAQADSLTEIIVMATVAYVGAQAAADFGKHRPTNTDRDGSGQ